MATNRDTKNGRNQEVLLLSIQPEFAEMIKQGTKTVELRKRVPKRIPSYALVYASHPKKEISFFIKIKRIDCAPKSEIWEKYHKRCGISQAFFSEYYTNKTDSVAIVISKVFEIDKKVTRNVLLNNGLTPPQDYRYVNANSLPQSISDELSKVSSPNRISPLNWISQIKSFLL